MRHRHPRVPAAAAAGRETRRNIFEEMTDAEAAAGTRRQQLGLVIQPHSGLPEGVTPGHGHAETKLTS
eukprot:11444489-Prorocentrum_lima.AAC.1